jgi:hypothetical protein
MVDFKGEPLDLNVGDIAIERVSGEVTAYWVVTKVIANDNPIRYGHTYKKTYNVFDLLTGEDAVPNMVFRPVGNWTYEIIRGQ